MARFNLIAWGLIVYSLLISTLAAQEPLKTSLHVEAWTLSGERLEKISVIAAPLSGAETYRGTGREVVLSLPIGEYMITVASPGFETRRQVVRAYGPTMLRTFALPIALMHGQTNPDFSGRIAGYRGNLRDLVIRLIPILGAEIMDAAPDTDGRFSFPAGAGLYILAVIAPGPVGPSVVEWRQLTLPEYENFTIQLGDSVNRR